MKLVLIILFFALPASAIESVTKKQQVTLKNEVVEGWTPKLKVATNYSIHSSNNVVGQTDGDSITVGFKLDSALNYAIATREWRNSLTYNGSTTRTASLPRYVKSDDKLKLETLYIYGFQSMPKLGPYASASAETATFKGEDIRSSTVTYNTPDGSFNGTTLKLTDAFAPFTTKQALGFFYKFISRPKTKLEARLGLGALQVKADDQLSVTESDDTTVTVEALEDYNQVGVEYGISFSGKWNDVSDYSLSADFLTPYGVEIDPGQECEGCSDFELTNIEVKAAASTKVNSWATVSYEYNAIKKPQLLNKFQIKHGLVLNIAYDFLAK